MVTRRAFVTRIGRIAVLAGAALFWMGVPRPPRPPGCRGPRPPRPPMPLRGTPAPGERPREQETPRAQ